MGVVKPAVVIHCEEGPDLFLPADKHDTIESVRLSVSRALGKPATDIGIFSEEGLEDDEFPVSACQEFTAAPVATMEICVVVPEGLPFSADSQDDELPGLKGVTVEIDGAAQGETDDTGRWSMVTRIGTRRVHLQHACFGSEGRRLEKLVALGQPNFWTVLADIRVYIFASAADADAEEDLLTSSSYSGHRDITVAGTERPSFGTVLVWICTSSEQIQGNMLSLAGVVSATGLGGKEISVNLGTGATEVGLVLGAEVEDGPLQRCSLASLRCEVNKLGFCWRPRDPSPLKDRAEEIGGCEYLRLLACPTVMGYLDPAVLVKRPNGSQLLLPAIEFSTVGKIKERMQEELSVPAKEMAIFQENSDGEMDDAAIVKAGMVLETKETAKVELRVVTGCCCEPFDGVSIAVDGQERGITDRFGKVGEFSLTEGEHSLKLEHMVFGQQGFAMKRISVTRGNSNVFTIVADTRFFIYTTDPDPEDLDAADVDMVPDPSCVWIAANTSHIPDDAVPLLGNVSYKTLKGEEMQAPLSSQELRASVLQFGISHAQEHCLMSSVGLQCARPGFAWEPKEPSVFAERLAEIGGCEFLRVLACPVALGWLKPAVTVQCATGQRWVVALSTCPTLEDLREHLTLRLGVVDSESLQLAREDGQLLTEETWTPSAMRLACAGPGESLAVAQELLSNIGFEEEAAKEEAEAATLAYLQRVEVANPEVEVGVGWPALAYLVETVVLPASDVVRQLVAECE